MAQFDENRVRLDGGIIVWDGITQPETQQAGTNAGKPKWTLKAVFPPTCSDLGLFDALAAKKLNESKFKGNLPAGGRMPIGQVKPGEFLDMFPGWFVISFKTTLRAPDVYAEDGQLLDPMQYGPMIFGGQKVNVLAHCYDYDSAGNKGISAGLDGLQIVTSANAQRLNLGGNGVDTSAAFGGNPNQGNQGGYTQGNQGQGGYTQGNQGQGGYNQGNQGQGGYNQGSQGQGGYNQGSQGQGGYTQGNQGQGGYNQGDQGQGGYNQGQGNQGQGNQGQGGYNQGNNGQGGYNQGNQGDQGNNGQGGYNQGNQGDQGNNGQGGYNQGQGGYNQGNQGGNGQNAAQNYANGNGPQQDQNFLPNR